MTTAYTHFQPIFRDEGGKITRTGPWQPLGCRTGGYDGGVSETLSVGAVESTCVAGWGHAEAIGTVVGVLECGATRFAAARRIDLDPVLALLGRPLAA